MDDYTDAEVEADRQERIVYVEIQDPKGFAPGTFGCHEALHLAHFFSESVGSYLTDHPAVLNEPEWFKLAHRAHAALFDLYQAIGAKHL